MSDIREKKIYGFCKVITQPSYSGQKASNQTNNQNRHLKVNSSTCINSTVALIKECQPQSNRSSEMTSTLILTPRGTRVLSPERHSADKRCYLSTVFKPGERKSARIYATSWQDSRPNSRHSRMASRLTLPARIPTGPGRETGRDAQRQHQQRLSGREIVSFVGYRGERSSSSRHDLLPFACLALS